VLCLFLSFSLSVNAQDEGKAKADSSKIARLNTRPDSSRLFQFRQKIESSKLVKLIQSEEHSPGKAALFSAVVPGWGQAYNRKYWKIPIVYAGLAAVGYFVVDNQKGYSICRDDYIRLHQDTSAAVLQNPYGLTTKSALLQQMSAFRDDRDLFVLITAAVWGLNVLDANVDGHFFNYDVSDDLSLNISPAIFRMPGRNDYIGLNLVFELH